jgi:hypothetical protein
MRAIVRFPGGPTCCTLRLDQSPKGVEQVAGARRYQTERGDPAWFGAGKTCDPPEGVRRSYKPLYPGPPVYPLSGQPNTGLRPTRREADLRLAPIASPAPFGAARAYRRAR